MLVLEGVFEDEYGRYAAGTWIRSPHLSEHHPYVEAETVICNADPKRLLSMVDPDAMDPGYRSRLEDWKIRSPVVKFNAALSHLPQWAAAPDSRRMGGRRASRFRAGAQIRSSPVSSPKPRC